MTNEETTSGGVLPLSSKTYDLGKKAVLVVLPAFSSLYFGLSQIWGFPSGEEVVGSTALLTVFLGTILGISSREYNRTNVPHAGDIIVENDPGGLKTVNLELNMDPDDLIKKNSVTFHVK